MIDLIIIQDSNHPFSKQFQTIPFYYIPRLRNQSSKPEEISRSNARFPKEISSSLPCISNPIYRNCFLCDFLSDSPIFLAESRVPNDAGILKLYASDKSDNKQRKEYRRKCADNPDEDPSCEGTLFLNFFHFSCAAFRGFRPALQFR